MQSESPNLYASNKGGRSLRLGKILSSGDFVRKIALSNFSLFTPTTKHSSFDGVYFSSAKKPGTESIIPIYDNSALIGGAFVVWPIARYSRLPLGSIELKATKACPGRFLEVSGLGRPQNLY